jgi:poly-gamma-glutamate capsule biosynthesis protein CapA/YwtB (metallophosphatase superfamily)
MQARRLGVNSGLALFLLLGLSGLTTAVEVVNPGPDETITMALVGDVLISRKVKQFDDPRDPRFQKMAETIRDADVAFLNLEVSSFRLSEFNGQPQAQSGGNWVLASPEMVTDLKHLGFDLMNRANNHTTDFGVEGMRLTNKHLDDIGIVHAGSGMSLGRASRPGYLDTIKGRVALVSFASTFTSMSRAGATRDDMVGRGGLNPLDIDDGQPITRDRERILHEIRNASLLSDFVIASSHTHGGNKNIKPPSWQPEFARACIDAGATTYVSHGPHRLRGIEIYKGKPIFYSLGDFIFQNETIDPMPAESYERYDLPPGALAGEFYDTRFKGGTVGFPTESIWYESVIAVPTFSHGELTELKLYPIELNQKAPRSQRGTPRMVYGETAERIIKDLAEISEPFGTKIKFKRGIGIWVR